MSATPRNEDRAELVRIVVSMTGTMVLAGLILGGVFLGTDRYQKVAGLARERRNVSEMLALDSSATVLEVRQYLDATKREVVYHARRFGDATAATRSIVFSLEGEPRGEAEVPAAAGGEAAPAGLRSLGRVFVARAAGAPAGFVVEGEARGYKNRIRFFVALSPGFEIRGVRVVEHEEDPGLGAEVATPWFQGQYLGRGGDAVAKLDVTRDPMPEDWRAALQELARTPAPAWREKHAAQLREQGTRPIYAVTGATISSRALTGGVRAAVDHFRRRWQLLAPYLGGPA